MSENNVSSATVEPVSVGGSAAEIEEMASWLDGIGDGAYKSTALTEDIAAQLAPMLRSIAHERNALKSALTDMLAGWKYIRLTHGDLYGVGWNRCQDAAETALAPPPPAAPAQPQCDHDMQAHLQGMSFCKKCREVFDADGTQVSTPPAPAETLVDEFDVDARGLGETEYVSKRRMRWILERIERRLSNGGQK